MKFIIVAGGQGTKIWPYSRKSNPKQFQTIIGDESLFSYNINTLLEEFPPEDILISTKKQYVSLALEQAPKIPLKNYIIEPDLPKGRGPGEGFAFLNILMKYPSEPFLIIQPDLIRIPAGLYLDMIYDLQRLVKRDKKFITGGVTPEYPMLGVDYFELGDQIEMNSNLKIYKTKKFLGRTEEYNSTKKLVDQGNAIIHFNHACWYADQMLEAYKKYHTNWYESLMKIKNVIGNSNEEEKIAEIYSHMEEGSTELVTKHIFEDGYLVKLPFKCIDIGTWNSVYEYTSSNGNGSTDSNILAMDSDGTLVKSTNKKKLIAALGVKDMIIIDTDDILLIVPKNKADKIKDIQKEIKNKNMDEYL